MNKIYADRITLRFASINDRKKIYEMMIAPGIADKMFDEVHPALTYEEFCSEGDFYYLGEASKEGSYLIIEYDNKEIGAFCYTCEYDKIPYCELDLWMASLEYTGLGLGSEAINRVIEFVSGKYGVLVFLIRPWIKNKNAIKTYKKCGFLEDDNLDIGRYYSDKRMRIYKDGYYGKEETCNLIKNL